jgi:O-antigen/teichoic acid export membrane protein
MGEGVGRLVVLLLVLVVLSRGLSGPLSGVGAYGLAIGLAPFVGIGVALVGQRGLFVPGPPAHLGDLSRAFGALLVASVATALVLNVSPLAVEVLADVGQEDEPGRFLNALLVARIPLFFFQAVQASLLPQLSGLAGSGRYGELWATLRRLLALVASIGAVAVAGAAVLGPWVVEMAFGGEFAVGRRDMVLLTTSSGVLMLVLALAQALIACRSQARVALAWVVGVAAFPVAVALFDDLFLRVEMGLIATVSVTALIMSVMLVRRLRHESAGPAG